MDHKEVCTNSSVNSSVNDGSTKFTLNSPTTHPSRSKSYDMGSNSLGKVETATTRPCAIIGPDRVLPPNPDDMYFKKMPGDAWPPPDNVYCHPADYVPTRNISPRQTFQENMQRIMVPPTFSSVKSSEVSNLKNPKTNVPQEAKYCDVPYNVNSLNSEHKSFRNPEIAMSNVNPSYPRNMPPTYGWPASVNVRPLRPYGAPEFFQYQELPSCAGPRPLTMIRPHRNLHEENAHVYSERLYQDANIRFKPYPTGKEKFQQPRYDYASNYPSTFHTPTSLPPHKYDLQKSIHGHPYPAYQTVPYKYIDRRIQEPYVDGYQRSHAQQASFNAFHSHAPPPYGPIPGNVMQNKSIYSDSSSKTINVEKLQFENNNKVYVNLESRSKNYSVTENMYYNDINHSQPMRGEILLPSHSTLNIPAMAQHSIYRRDNTLLKPYNFNSSYRMFDQSSNVHHSLQRLPLQFSPSTISPNSNTSHDINTIGTSQEDCGYVSQSSTASIRSFDSGIIPMQHDICRRFNYNNYDMAQNTFHSARPIEITKNTTTSSNKKNLNVRQFLQMWNEGDEEVSEANKERASANAAPQILEKINSQNENINSHEQLYVLGLVNVPNEELGKYDHIQKISKLPENIKGYNSIEILNQYEELLETPNNKNYSRLRDYSAALSKSQIDKDITTKMPRPVSPLDVEAKISQSVIHKEVGCNFEIKPCSPEMMNAEIAAPVQNIIGERIIEKVVNQNTKSPKLISSDNHKSQNMLDNVINIASCKMISNQYSSKTKTNKYSIQDFERNAGLCLASLPPLDNDIEINFPEINQQFIKANKIGSNIASDIQNLSHVDVDHTMPCLKPETKNSNPQKSLSPQLALSSGVDKEFSKLSKYRKSKKCDIATSSSTLDKYTIKSTKSIAALQRIDSVIIKNPDTNKLQDYDSATNTDPSHALEYEGNIETSDTAIDFSLNKSEEETAVRYLNAMEKNVNKNLPQLEVFGEGSLNEGEEKSYISSNVNVDMSPKLNITPSQKVFEAIQCEHILSSSGSYVNECNIDQETDESKCCNPIKSSIANLDHKVLVMRNVAPVKPQAISIEDQITNTDNIKYDKPFEITIQNNTNCGHVTSGLSEGNLFTPPKLAISKCKRDTKINEIILTDKLESKIVLSNSVIQEKYQCNVNKSKISIENEVSHHISEIYDSESISKHETIEVLKDLSWQDTNNLKNIPGVSALTTENYCISKELTIPKNVEDKKETIESESKNSHIYENDKVINVGGISSPSVQTETKSECINNYQSRTSIPNETICKLEKNSHGNKEPIKALFQKDSKEKNYNTPAIVLPYAEEVLCAKNGSDLPDLTIETAKNNPLKSFKIQKNTEENMVPSENFCRSVIHDLNQYDKNLHLLPTKTILQDTKNDAIPLNDCAKHHSDVFDVQNISNKLASSSDNDQKDINILNNAIESSEEFRESKHLSYIAMEHKEVNDIGLTEPPILHDNVHNSHHTSIDGSCSLVSKTDHVILNDEATEYKQETKVERNLEVEPKFKIDSISSVELKSFSETTSLVIKNDMTEESCCFIKNKTTEKAAVTIAECKKDTNFNSHLLGDYRNISKGTKGLQPESESQIMYTPESEFDVEESYLTLNSTIVEDNSAFVKPGLECSIEIHLNTIKKKFKTDIDQSECNSLSDIHSISKDIEFSSPIICEITPDISERLENKNLMGTKKVKLDVSKSLDLLTSNLLTSEYKSDLKDESKTLDIDNKSLDARSSLNQGVVIHKRPDCQKELFSPWIQNLLMFTEGVCELHKDIYSIGQETNRFINTKPILSEDVEVFNSNLNISFNHVGNLLNTMESTNEEMSESYKNQSTSEENCYFKKYQGEESENTQFTSVVTNYNVAMKPQKISKRSLSESALEAYKTNDNINFIQPCKRKRGIKANQRFLDSHVITENICNIIQNNRRNSISTFYNEDNVYIVIDNDLILTEENDGSNKTCFTESTKEFMPSIESTSCEINLISDSTDSCLHEQPKTCEYLDSLQHSEEKTIQESWVDDVACIETVFSEDVAENIIIDVHETPKNFDPLVLESGNDESTLVYDRDHLDKLKSIYGRTICNDNTQLIETLYRTPQMNVNKTLYNIEPQDFEESLETINDCCLEPNKSINSYEIMENGILSEKLINNHEILSKSISLDSEQCDQSIFQSFIHCNDVELEKFTFEGQENEHTSNSCESNKYLTSHLQKENSNYSYSYSSSPEVSSTTSEEKNNSSILLKITNCNGSRVSQINEIKTDVNSKLSYKLTENREYQSYSSSFTSSRKLITKAAQKYIPPLQETIYDLKVKLPLPQHRLQTLKQLKTAKVEPRTDATARPFTVDRPNQKLSKKQKPKFEDVLKSIDEINFKKHKKNIKKGKNSIPKVIIKKNKNGAHYASSRSENRNETYNPDLTGRKWQPWVFLDKNLFIDQMALHNKAKAIYCHRKKSYILLEKFHKYKSVYNASFVISQPNSETIGNLKYTIRLKHNN